MPGEVDFLCKVCGTTEQDSFYCYYEPRRKKHYYEKSRCKQCTNKRRKHYDSSHKRKDNHLKKNYGISFQEYLELLFTDQQGQCAACYKKVSDDPQWENRMWPVDHDHVTGKVRGVLCHQCNKALGFARDSVEVLEQLIVYLKRGE